MIKNKRVLNILSVVSILLAVIAINFATFNILQGAFVAYTLYIAQALSVILLLTLGPLTNITKKSVKFIFSASVQIPITFIIGVVSTIWATEAVAVLFPDDPALFGNAFKTAVIIGTIMLWEMAMFFILLAAILVSGFSVMTADSSKLSSQKLLYRFAIFIGLLSGFFSGYKELLQVTINFSGSNSKQLIVDSQLYRNNRCSNIDSFEKITSASNKQVLIYRGVEEGRHVFKRSDCILYNESKIIENKDKE